MAQTSPRYEEFRGYTDGSEMYASGSGIAIFRQGSDEPIHTDSQFVGTATVFQAELNAITMACQACMALDESLYFAILRRLSLLYTTIPFNHERFSLT
jgi:hypothetical protein